MASTTVVQPTTTTATTTIPNENQNPPTVNSNLTSNNPKKRSFDHVSHFQTSPYFKIRTLVKQLRPVFLQVLRAPDIQNCEAGREIQEKMKLMIDLCKQKSVTESTPLAKCNNGAGSLDMGISGQKHAEQPSQGDRSFLRPAGNNPDKQTHEGNRIPGTYIVGGSAFGWNFITFHGTKPEYYGRTKEAFRAGN